MSEFKFTCPVCGQHIAADAAASGVQIECPTCFQKIIVPEAPRAGSKYILSATQYIKSHAVPPLRPATRIGQPALRRKTVTLILSVWILACSAGVVLYVLFGNFQQPGASTSPPASASSTTGAGYGVAWSLNLAKHGIPQRTASGRIHGKDFRCERARLQMGALLLRQDTGDRPELNVNVYFGPRPVEELAGKTYGIATNSSGVTPRIVLRWKEGELRVSQLFTNGYAMKLELGPIASDHVPGSIYLCLPDASRSVVAGTFEAEVRKPFRSRRP